MNLKNSLFNIPELSSFNRSIEIPTSKSHANRALILAAIYGSEFKIHNLSDSTDVINLLKAFAEIGLRFTQKDQTIIFHNSFPACEREVSRDVIELHTGDGGTTNRFLLALLSRGSKTYQLFPSEMLAHRPIDDLLNPLRELEVQIAVQSSDESKPWVTLQGPASMIKTSVINVDCKKSTQFASAMMLAFSNLPLTINCTNIKASETYIEMTRAVLKSSLRDLEYTIPVDFSSLSYPIALAALKGEVQVRNALSIDPFQADSALIELLKKIGANVSWTKEGLVVSHFRELDPFEFNVSEAPDLFPTLVFLASHIEGESKFYKLEVLGFKESDRLLEMKKIMDAFEVSYHHNEKEDELTIKGRPSKYKRVSFHPPRDHRIVMSASLFMAANHGGEIEEVDAVTKSYPQFFELIK